MKKQVWTGVAASLAAGLILVAAAAGGGNNGNVIENGGFETGNSKPWKKDGGPAGGWFVYQDYQGAPFFPPPVQGDFAIGAYQGDPTGMTLTQKFRLPQNKPANLFFWLAYVEFEGCICPAAIPKSVWRTPSPKACAPDAKIPCGGYFCTPDTIDVNGPFCNQQLRVDILRANADPKSFDPKDVLQTLFLTEDGDPFYMDWTPFSFDVSQFAGRQIQVRFLVTATFGPLFAAVDGVAIYKTGTT